MPGTGHEREPDRGGPAARLEREATEWFFRRDAGFTSDDEQAFNRWLSQDERHGRALAEIEATWRALGSARDRIPLPFTSVESPPGRGQWRVWRRAALAAAAAIVFSGIGWVTARHMGIGGLPAANAGWAFAEQAATELGGLRKMDLPDGSFVTLNANSAADVQFTRLERRVRLLRGEAHFSVAKDLGRPFVVEAKGVAVRAVGTAFNVRLQADTVEVLVTEGRVQVQDAARGRSLLSPAASNAEPDTSASQPENVLRYGEKVVIPVQLDAVPLPVVAVSLAARDIEAAIGWQKRRLEYVDAPLSEIAADFNRFNQHQIVIADANLASRRFGGTFHVGDHQSLVQILEETFEVTVERRERETILRLP